MITFGLDLLTGDLSSSVVSGSEALAVRIKCSLQLRKRENRYNQTEGFDWAAVFAQRTPPAAVKARIRSHLLKIPGVRTVDYIRLVRNPTTRKDSIDFSVNQGTTKGTV